MVSVSLFGKRNRLRTDFFADLSEGRFDRHAGFDADQQKVERVWERPLDRQLPLGDAVFQKHQRQVHAGIRRAEAQADLDGGRLVPLDHHKKIEQAEQQQHRRCHHAEEQKRDVGRLAAETGLHELFARRFLRQPFGQVKALDHLGHVLLGRLAQTDLFAARQALALALPDLLALDRHRLHPAGKRVGREQRHRQRQYGRDRCHGGERHGQEFRVVELCDDKLDHGALRNRN